MSKKGENIHKRKDGLWEGRYPCGKAENGRTKYASVYAMSYAEVKGKQLAAKTKPPQKPVSKRYYKDVLLEWLEVQAISVKPSTCVKLRNLTKGISAHRWAGYSWSKSAPLESRTSCRTRRLEGG